MPVFKRVLCFACLLILVFGYTTAIVSLFAFDGRPLTSVQRKIALAATKKTKKKSPKRSAVPSKPAKLFIGPVANSADLSAQKSKQQEHRNSVNTPGKMSVRYTPPKNKKLKKWETELRDSKLFEKLAESYNQFFFFPNDTTIDFQECGGVNAYYDLESKRIIMCYELFSFTEQLFTEQQADKPAMYTMDVALFVFQHEFGHALIDMWKLPVTGREEDVADQLAAATFIGPTADPLTDEIVMATVAWFNLLAGSQEINSLPFWDEHSFEKQRVFNLVCWVYGAHPKEHAHWIKDFKIPESRAKGCRDEYQKLTKGWNEFLLIWANPDAINAALEKNGMPGTFKLEEGLDSSKIYISPDLPVPPLLVFLGQAPKSATPAKGKLKLSYKTAKRAELKKLSETLQTMAFYDDVVATFNESFILPKDISVVFQECGGEEKAYYDKDKTTVVMCYELYALMTLLFHRAKDPKPFVSALASGTYAFYHELGHALIDTLKLPVTGREEDVADQFATYLLIGSGNGKNDEIILKAALWFDLAAERDPGKQAFWSAHGFDRQRFYNILCWAYGVNPETHQNWTKSNILPESRAPLCADEYQKIEASWTRYMGPWVNASIFKL